MNFFPPITVWLPKSLGGSEENARKHFAEAVELSSGNKASPFVTLASTLCVKTGRKAEFEELMKKALSIKPDAERSMRLQNIIYQQKAAWMLANEGKYFKDEGEGEKITP